MNVLYVLDEHTTDENLRRHAKFLVQLLQNRAKSLIGTYMKPPWRYASLLCPQEAPNMRKLMDAEWKLVLEAEALVAKGHKVLPLQVIPSVQTAFVRLHYLANERDIVQGMVDNELCDGTLLAKVATHHIADTVVVENTHQRCKDLMRDARHAMSSRVAKFNAVINSNVFSGRGIHHLKVDNMTKATSHITRSSFVPLVKATNPNNLAM